MVENDRVLTQQDKNALKMIESFLPEKIFDMHSHICDSRLSSIEYGEGSCFTMCGDPLLGMAQYAADQGRLYGQGKKLRVNMIMTADPAMEDKKLRRACVEFIARQLEENPNNVAEVPVLAGDTREDVEAMLIHPRIRGFKCYHWTVKKENTWQCGIEDYISEAVWQVAQERGMCITLHMVRNLALSDPGNLSYICTMAKKYPNAKLILAHAARGFAAWTVTESVQALAEIPNVYFDVAAVCEAEPIFAIIKACGHKRVLWGTDYPVSMLRGKCVSIGSAFLWLYKEELNSCSGKKPFNAYLIGVEGLLAMRSACNMLSLDRSAVEDIFYNNAMALLGMTD